MDKNKLIEIVQKSVENAWYNRRSLNPVKEQTEIIVNGIWEQLNKPKISNRWSDEEKKDLQNFLYLNASESSDNYQTAADYLNEKYNKNRTASACKTMDKKFNNN